MIQKNRIRKENRMLWWNRYRSIYRMSFFPMGCRWQSDCWSWGVE